jgi:hypothetical protein
MKLPITIVAFLASLANLSAATYQVGDIVTNFTLIARRTFTNDAGRVFDANAPIQLRDFEGRIVLLEFFAVW